MADPATGRPVYVDHNTKTTSWEHPVRRNGEHAAGYASHGHYSQQYAPHAAAHGSPHMPAQQAYHPYGGAPAGSPWQAQPWPAPPPHAQPPQHFSPHQPAAPQHYWPPPPHATQHATQQPAPPTSVPTAGHAPQQATPSSQPSHVGPSEHAWPAEAVVAVPPAASPDHPSLIKLAGLRAEASVPHIAVY